MITLKTIERDTEAETYRLIGSNGYLLWEVSFDTISDMNGHEALYFIKSAIAALESTDAI
jgi:hypothetical protein